MSGWRHARAVLMPVTVAIVVPAVLVWWTGTTALPLGLRWLGGVPLVAFGLALVVWTIRLFATAGKGTLAPWDPTSRLVVRGPYRHVRNPMITGVGCVLAGEALLLGSIPVLLWLACFAAVNALYLPLVEEPGLARRFGADYDEYRANVPRWIPKLRAWSPPA